MMLDAKALSNYRFEWKKKRPRAHTVPERQNSPMLGPHLPDFGSNAALLDALGLNSGASANAAASTAPTSAPALSPALSLGASKESCANGSKPVKLNPFARKKYCAPTKQEHKDILREKKDPVQGRSTISKNHRTPGQVRKETEKQRKTWKVQEMENPNARRDHLKNLISSPLAGPLSALQGGPKGDARLQIVGGELGGMLGPRRGKSKVPNLAHKNMPGKKVKYTPSKEHSRRYKGGSPRRK